MSSKSFVKTELEDKMDILKLTEARNNKGWAMHSIAVWAGSLSKSLYVPFVINGMKYTLLGHNSSVLI